MWQPTQFKKGDLPQSDSIFCSVPLSLSHSLSLTLSLPIPWRFSTATLSHAHTRTCTHTRLNTWTQKCTHTRTCKHARKLLLCYPSCAKEKSKLSDENFFGLRRFKNIFVGDAHDGRPSIFYSIEKQRQPLKSKSFPASARSGAASADIFILRLELFPLKI